MNATRTIYLSKQGMKELKKEIARLERDKATALARLREIDKTDGRDERLARAEQLAILEVIDSELSDKKATLLGAKIFPRKRDAISVALGSVVDLIDTQGRIVRYRIVESIEANPSDGRISANSPLGQSLIGKKIKDVVEWGTGLKTNRFELVSIG